MVIADKRWDIIAIDAATVVSLPRELGITIVFSPRGIASEHRAHRYHISFWGFDGRSSVAAIKIRGITNRRTREMMIVRTSEKVFFSGIAETTIPVSNIATGDIQLPDMSTKELSH